MPVLFRIRAVAVAVLEVDSEILDRLALELRAHALVNVMREFGGNPEHGVEGIRGGRMLVHETERDVAKLARRVRPKEMPAAIDGVNRLPGNLH